MLSPGFKNTQRNALTSLSLSLQSAPLEKPIAELQVSKWNGVSQCGYMTPLCSFVCLAAVCAEAYNPDDDEDDDTEPRVVNPKTDEQRRRLQDACRDILLFKTLEQV